MKKLPPLSIVSALSVLLASVVSVALAEDEFPKPGPEHELLKSMAGEWKSKVTYYEPGTGKPNETEGEYSAKMTLGGFFLIADYTSDFGGQPFQGHGVTGYDPHKKSYVGSWVDSMGPGIYRTRGKFNKKGNTYTEHMNGPGPDGKPMKFRSVTKIEDDQMHFTLFMQGEDEKETKMMELHHTRKE